MNTLYKQDGTPVQVNNESLEYALSLGWTKAEPKKDPVKKPTKKAK